MERSGFNVQAEALQVDHSHLLMLQIMKIFQMWLFSAKEHICRITEVVQQNLGEFGSYVFLLWIFSLTGSATFFICDHFQMSASSQMPAGFCQVKSF